MQGPRMLGESRPKTTKKTRKSWMRGGGAGGSRGPGVAGGVRGFQGGCRGEKTPKNQKNAQVSNTPSRVGGHYTSDINSANFLFSFWLEKYIYHGWCLRCLHSNGASFVFPFVFLHLGRAISYASFCIIQILGFWNCYLLLLNGHSIYGLCCTCRTNEFMRTYRNYKFIVSISIFNRMALWRTLYLQSNIKEVLCLSFSVSISSVCFSSYSYC